MESTKNNTFSHRLSANLVSLAIILLLLYFGKGVLLPIFFAVLLAALLLPVTNYLMRKRFPKAIAILLPLVTFILISLGIVYFLSNQVVHFFDDLPTLKEKVNEQVANFQQWLNQHINLPVYKQNKYLEDGMDKLQELGPTILGSTVLTLIGALSYVVLLPIYTFLMIYYKDRIKDFLTNVFKNGSVKKVKGILSECANVSQRYVLGLCLETVIVFTLNTIGFLIIGIRYPIFLALLTALLNLIPYVGIITANVLCVVITLLSADNPIDALWVAIVLLLVQFYDNNFGMPLVVGNQVRINALVTIIGILVGGVLCGIPGMFLAIPGLAVLKIIFDRVPELEPWGTLLGDDSNKEKKKG